jgi:hypothetical protein
MDIGTEAPEYEIVEAPERTTTPREVPVEVPTETPAEPVKV